MKDKKPKMTRKEREKQMIAEMESALWEKKTAEGAETSQSETVEQAQKTKKQEKHAKGKANDAEQTMHCSRCGTLMEKGKCPNCGHYIYMPMDKATRSKIRWIVGGICVIGFVILFVLLQINS